MTGSAFEFRLADVGEGLHEAEVKRWLVQPGERVSLDQPLVEIETDKAVVELPSPVAGTVARLGAEEGAILHVGDVVVLLEVAGESGDRAGSAGTTVAANADREPARLYTAAREPIAQDAAHRDLDTSRRPLATPAVRKLARELGVDLSRVPASGPGGRILASDVESFAQVDAGRNGDPAAASLPQPPPVSPSRPSATAPIERRPPGDGEVRQPLRGLRRRIAQTMTQAWSTIPHITGFDEVEVSALVATRERLKPIAAARGARLTFFPFVVKAVTIALREHPIVNASLDEAAQEIIHHTAANIGIATATPDGLIVPVLHDAAGMTLVEIQQHIDALTQAARERRSTPQELRGGTFTITNFGALGGWQAAPIIRPGEAAILGVGRIQDRPWAVAGQVEVRPVLALSLAADHRLIDGDVSTAFLTRVGSLLTAPDMMLLDL